MEPIELIQASNILKEYTTKGSKPLLVMANKGDLYVAKTSIQIKPTVEVINEVLCAYFAQCWRLNVPDFSLIQIGEDIYQKYIGESGALSNNYTKDSFGERKYFGSKIIEGIVELESYFEDIKGKHDFNQFRSPSDLIKIGVFDQWIGNYDRRPDSPNILLSVQENLFEFHPIDHTAAFANLTDYKKVRDIMLRIDPAHSILSHPLLKKIVKFVDGNVLQNLKTEFLDCINHTVGKLDLIFSQVPGEFGFSNKDKVHLKSFFTDEVRNKRIASSYLTFLR